MLLTDAMAGLADFPQMFRVASGDPWPASLPLLDENGSLDGPTCVFMCSFVILVAWVRDSWGRDGDGWVVGWRDGDAQEEPERPREKGGGAVGWKGVGVRQG